MPPLKGIEAVAAKAAYGLYTFTGDLFFFNIEMRHSTYRPPGPESLGFPLDGRIIALNA